MKNATIWFLLIALPACDKPEPRVEYDGGGPPPVDGPRNPVGGQGGSGQPEAGGFGQPGTRPPLLALDLEGAADGVFQRGWPLVLTATVVQRAPRRTEPTPPDPLLLSGPGGWTTSLTVVARTTDGQPLDWTALTSVTTASLTAVVDADSSPRHTWLLAADQTATLPLGPQRLTVSLDTTSAAEGWRGVAPPAHLDVTIVDPPATPTPAEVAGAFMARIGHHRARGDGAGALATCREYAAAQPDNPSALELLGDALMAEGDPAAAYRIYTQALALFSEPAAAGSNHHAPGGWLMRKLRAAFLTAPPKP